MRWFSAFLNEVANEQEYKQTLTYLTITAGRGQQRPRECRLRCDRFYQCTRCVLSDTERHAAIEALERHDNRNSVYRGFHYMLNVVQPTWRQTSTSFAHQL